MLTAKGKKQKSLLLAVTPLAVLTQAAGAGLAQAPPAATPATPTITGPTAAPASNPAAVAGKAAVPTAPATMTPWQAKMAAAKAAKAKIQAQKVAAYKQWQARVKAAAAAKAAPETTTSSQAAAITPAANPPVTPPAVVAKPRPAVHHPTAREVEQEAAARANEGDYLGAISAWSKIIQPHNPERLAGYMQRSTLKRHIGDYKGALQDLDLALQSYPHNVPCLLERAALRRRQGDNNGALEDLNKAVELSPHKADAYVDRGWLKMAMGDYPGSIADYHSAVQINPALKNKLVGMGQPQVNLHLDNEGNEVTPGMEHYNNEKAFADNKEKDREKDKDKEDHIAGHIPKTALSQVQLAHLNNAAVKEINDGQFEAATKTLKQLMSAAPDYAHARENLCIAHNNWGLELAKRTPALAARQFRQAIFLDPSQGASRRNLDAMIKQTGKNPKNADARLEMARESLAAGDREGAFVEATEAIKLRNNAAVRMVLRQVLAALDEQDHEEQRILSSQAPTPPAVLSSPDGN